NDQPSEKPFYELGSFWKLMEAKNHNDYKQALKGYENPAQNFAFASRDGDVAITVNGSLPVKRDQQGRFIQDGSKSSNGWNGFIPRDQLPQVLNPERGYISSANQKSTDEDYPYYYNSEGFDDYRGRSVNLRLDSMEEITVKDMMEMQTTSFSLFAKDVMEATLPLLDKSAMNDAEKDALETLEDWDYYCRADAFEPVLFQSFSDSLYRMTFDEFYAYREEQSVLFPKSSRLLSLLTDVPAHNIFDHQKTKGIEDGKTIVNKAFKAAVANVPEGENWASRNNASVPHMAGLEPFGRVGLTMSGSNRSLNAIRRTHGPSWRMVVEMAKDGVQAYGLYPGGQSGNPGSAYYDNMVDTWAKGDYDKLIFPKNKQEMESSDYLFKMTFTN
ncbi:MAG: penicillin acylase family protein, partial [Bacteroidota bacterium]